ncbi:hypothetical protein ATO6_12345 [Oceanicola sp. 22II-s10i]|nr:hypothetical protein ATO6_12345 [Oceanicola sp. 22II-s10i]
MASMAVAGDANKAFVEQDGNNNAASIDQSAGPGGNDFATLSNPATQRGNDNQLRFSNGSANNNHNNRFNNDVNVAEQIGNGNWMNITVGNLSNNNTVEDAQQLGDTNSLLVSLNGSRGGTIETVLQDGNVNSAVLKQSGNDNTIQSVSMIGDDNGYANRLELTSGRFASLRILQTGNTNLVTSATIEGSNNRQIPSNGYAPLLDIRQTGNMNIAFGNMLGSDGNYLNILQNGTGNDAGVNQGSTAASTQNDADIDQIGDGNYVRATQTGSYNALNASFTGEDNGVGTMSGDAGTLVSSHIELTQGSILQDSALAASGNTIDYTVVGNDNMFAFAQIGGGNTITGLVGNLGASNLNQAAIIQVGSSNMTSFSQNGGGSNNLAVSQ